jgi:hypothetical protein
LGQPAEVKLTDIPPLYLTISTTVALKKQEIPSWLEAPDPSKTHNRLLEEHHEGTGEWFLFSDRFERWKKTSCRIMWIIGIRMFHIVSSIGIGTHW